MNNDLINDLILVLDFGGNQAYYTARRLRGERFYCELLPGDTTPEQLAARAPRGVILAGGDERDDELPFDPQLLGVPVLALGGAARLLARRVGAKWASLRLRDAMEFMQLMPSPLFEGLSDSERRFARVDDFELPEGYRRIAALTSDISPAFSDDAGRIFGVQFYVESNDPDGLVLLTNFAGGICGLKRSWTVENFAPMLIETVRRRLGEHPTMIPVTGSMESVVAAALLHRAIGDRLTCLFIETGLLRKGEPEALRDTFDRALGIPLTTVNARERFLGVLSRTADPVEKRRLVHDEYAAVFIGEFVKSGMVERMAEGTSFPDILHRNPRLVERMIDGCDPYEPLSRLYKEDVRALGRYLGVPEAVVTKPTYEFCGLSVRCLGRVNAERLDMLRHADAILSEEMERADLSRRAGQYFAVLTDIRTPGEGGEGYVCVLRALTHSNEGRAGALRLPYDVMDALVRRITGEVKGINHVVYDITGRPTAAVEWE